MRKIYVLIVLSGFTFFVNSTVNAQALPVGTPVLEDYYRQRQLLGKADSDISFTLRPIYRSALNLHDLYRPDSTVKNYKWVQAGPMTFGNGSGLFQILPFSWQQQFNSDHPYGWNDGPMIPAKGYQTMVSGGFFVKYGPLSIQFRPEFVYAANPFFNGFVNAGRPDENYIAYYAYFNQIDQPERLGSGAYTKAFLGQSSIRLTFGGISFGLSNENLWWGPGIQNALLLSNNAPGFKHLTLNTVRPLRTFLGTFEGQLIAGRLDGTGQAPLSLTSLPDGTNLYSPKINDWRYFTGFNINYHPRWIPGLVFGLTRTFDAYHRDVNSFSEYVPFFFPYQKQNTDNGDPIPRDQETSFYTRWLFKKAQAELYFEYGLNDNSYNLRDFIGSPEHSRAYIFGFRKMLPINSGKDQHFLFAAEITQLSQSADRLVREAEGWYQHGAIRDGQTNEGQILGAGTGSGGNLQFAGLSWVSGLKKLGLEFERYEHAVDFSNNAFPDINGNSRKWVDFAFGFTGNIPYKNLLFNTKLQAIKSLNYEWILNDYVPAEYYIPHNDAFNLHAELGVTLLF